MHPTQVMSFLKLAWNRLAREAPPAADAERRGMLTIDRIGAGARDELTFVRKTAAEGYEWATAATADQLHAAVTVADTASVDLTLAGQQVSAAVLPAGVSHAGLANLAVGDPHTQYLLETGGTISGALTVQGNAALGDGNNDLTTFTGRIKTLGGTFTTTTGPAAGTGGGLASSRLRGCDTAGELQVVTGSSGTGTGILVTVNFAQARPDVNYLVLLTASSSDASDLQPRFTARTTSGFDIAVNTAPGANETLQFAFLVVEVAAL